MTLPSGGSGDEAMRIICSWTVPVTLTTTVPLPASTGNGCSAAPDIARICTPNGRGGGGSLLLMPTSRIT